MQVIFYNFNKKINSTARPTLSGTTIDCIIKDGSSQLSPTIRIKWSSGAAPVYNYAYIAAFGARYYFVSDWTFEERQWTARLTVDVLATYKTSIGGLSKYVLRSASAENVDAIDTAYSSISGYDTVELDSTPALGWSTYGSAGGSFVATVVGEQNEVSGNNVSIYSLKGTQLQTLIANMINKMSLAANQLSGNDTWTVLKQIMQLPFAFTTDVTQFLKNVMWFPFEFSNGGYVKDVYLGPYKAIQTGALVSNPIHIDSVSISLAGVLPTGTRKWEYMAPYGEYYLNFPPFGMIPIDAADVLNGTEIEIDVRTDAMSGLGFLSVTHYNQTTGEVRAIAQKTAQVGVTIPYGGWAPNYTGAISGAMGVLVAANAGEYGKFMMPSAIGNAIASGGFTGYSAGTSSGGASIIGTSPKIFGRIRRHVDIDPNELGYPLCEIRQINTLSGYVKVQDGDITSLTATDSELMQVKSYLEGGFFYE